MRGLSGREFSFTLSLARFKLIVFYEKMITVLLVVLFIVLLYPLIRYLVELYLD